MIIDWRTLNTRLCFLKGVKYCTELYFSDINKLFSVRQPFSMSLEQAVCCRMAVGSVGLPLPRGHLRHVSVLPHCGIINHYNINVGHERVVHEVRLQE